MIAIFSTLDEGRAERSFFERVQAAAPHQPVTRFVMSNRSEVVSDQLVRIAWSLASLPHQPPSQRTSPLELPPGCLEKWNRRWSRCSNMASASLAETLRAYAEYVHDWFVRIRPTCVLVSSNSVPHTGIPFDLASAWGVPRAAFERGYLPESFQISAYGSGPFSNWSDVPLEELPTDRTAEQLRRAGTAFLPELRAFSGRRPQPQGDEPVPERGQSGSTRRPPYRVLFLPVADVSFSVYPLEHPDHDLIMPCFEDSIDIARRLHQQAGFDVVVKPHPTERRSSRWRELAETMRVSHADAMPWIDWADVVVCNGTTLEFSAIARDTPVVLAGRSVLSNKGIAAEVQDGSLLAEAVRRAAADGVSLRQHQRFVQLVGWLLTENLLFPERANHWVTERHISQQLAAYGVSVDDSRYGFGKVTEGVA